MIETPTLLILGAGASAPYGYPLGSELRDNINKDLVDFIKKEYNSHWAEDLNISPNLITKFTQRFDMAMSYSIDSFLAHQTEEIVAVGKLAIVNQIANSESPQRLFYKKGKDDNSLRFSNDDDWYRYLVNKITNNVPLNKVEDNNFEVITFNYDRSLEMCLMGTLSAFYSIDHKESADLMKNFPIHHMYGEMDPIPLDIPLPGNKNSDRQYGAPPSSEKIKEISKNIKLVHEAKDDKTVDKANKMIKKTDRIYFLGLDLRNEENLNLFDKDLFTGKNLIGTVVGLEQAEINLINQYFGGHLSISTNTKSELTIRRLNPF
ncbi:MAG: hypothetical protein ABFC34_06625 [Methanobacterium sp.]